MKSFKYSILLLILVGCNNYTSGDYIEWVENPEHGLRVNKIMHEVKYSVQFRPIEYVAVKELYRSEGESFSSIKEELDGLQYFCFEFSNNSSNKDILKIGLSKIEDYYKRLEFFSFPAHDCFTLIDGRDTLKNVLYHYERSQNISPVHKVLLGFEDIQGKSLDDKILSYNDKVFGAGIINFCIKKESLEQLPKLKQ